MDESGAGGSASPIWMPGDPAYHVSLFEANVLEPVCLCIPAAAQGMITAVVGN